MPLHTTSAEEQRPWLNLTLVPGISPGAQRALLQQLGSPHAVLETPEKQVAAIAGIEVARRLARGADPGLVDRTLEWLLGTDNHLLSLGDSGYPRALLAIPDPPTVLYVHGKPEALQRECIAIVGSRNATPQGARDAQAFAAAISRAGYCIVSGLALGIDAAAHRGGMEGGGGSIAVVGTGMDIVYPARNRDLAHQLASAGCLLSEFALGTPSMPGNFPRRNRLISGLSLGVLVVEAAQRSGSLITARFALEQGRDVFAMPGSIHSTLSKGCHELIKQGAKLVESADDVLAEFTCVKPRVREKIDPAGAIPPHPLLEAMGFAPITADQIAQRTGLGAAELSAQLTRLEVEGRISMLAGGRFQRIDRIV